MKRFFLLAIVSLLLTVSVYASNGLEKEVKVNSDVVKIQIEGNNTNISTFLYGKTTYVPIRAVSENLGAKVDYNNKTKEANIYFGDNTQEILESTNKNKPSTKKISVLMDYISFKIDGKVAGINNFFYDGTVYIPIRAVSENLGATVDYDKSTKIANIYFFKKKTSETAGVTTTEKVLELVNLERKKAGLSEIRLNPEVTKEAQLKVEDMINLGYFSHESPTYGTVSEQLKNANIVFSMMGENIALGQTTPEEVMDAWMNSDGHKANILEPNFTDIGIGFLENYWVQIFIK
ncbi:MAG: CAP domain-containing protein [Lachnospirales bacterium]